MSVHSETTWQISADRSPVAGPFSRQTPPPCLLTKTSGDHYGSSGSITPLPGQGGCALSKGNTYSCHQTLETPPPCWDRGPTPDSLHLSVMTAVLLLIKCHATNHKHNRICRQVGVQLVSSVGLVNVLNRVAWGSNIMKPVVLYSIHHSSSVGNAIWFFFLITNTCKIYQRKLNISEYRTTQTKREWAFVTSLN